LVLPIVQNKLACFREVKDSFIQLILNIKTAKTSTMLGSDLQFDLGTPPVVLLGIVSDHVAGPHTDPLRDWLVLLHLLGELCPGEEGLVGRDFEEFVFVKFFRLVQ
jgi:hypothetical protein